MVEIAALIQHRHHFVAHDQAAHRDVARGQALGDGHHVRLEVVEITAEPLAGATKTTNHFIGHEQDVVLGQDFLDAWPVGGWRHNHTARALDRLGNKGTDSVDAQFEDFFFELIGRPDTELFRGHIATFTEPVRLRDVGNARNRQIALFVHVGHAAQAGTGHGRTVVAVFAADDGLFIRLALDRPVMANHAQHGVVALRA